MKMLKMETTAGAPEHIPTPASEFLDLSAGHLIFNYLANNCYAESAAAFLAQWMGPAKDVAASLGSGTEAYLLQTLEYRGHLRGLLRDGRMAEAMRYLDQFFPHLLNNGDMQDGEGVSVGGEQEFEGWLKFRLLCQQFVELVRMGDATAALEFIETSLNPLAATHPKFYDYLQSVVVLLAYANPHESPVKHLLSMKHREDLADQVNAAILKQRESSLETVLRQSLLVNSYCSASSTTAVSTDADSSASRTELANFLQQSPTDASAISP